MTLRSTPDKSPTQSLRTVGELSQLDTGALVDGDAAFTRASLQFWYLAKSSTEPLSATVLATKNSNAGALAGRWILRQTVTPSGTGAGNIVVGTSRGFFVDPTTTAPAANQTGAISSPFATIAQAVTAVSALSNPKTASIFLMPGTYAEAINLNSLTAFDQVSIVGLGEFPNDTVIAPTTGAPFQWTPTTVTSPASSFRLSNVRLNAPDDTTYAIDVDGTNVTAPNVFLGSTTEFLLAGLDIDNVMVSGAFRFRQLGIVRMTSTTVLATTSTLACDVINCSLFGMANATAILVGAANVNLTYDTNNPVPALGRLAYTIQASVIAALGGGISLVLNGQPAVSMDKGAQLGIPTITGFTSNPAEPDTQPNVLLRGRVLSITATFPDDVVGQTQSPIFDISQAICESSISFTKAVATQAIFATVRIAEAILDSSLNLSGFLNVDMRQTLVVPALLIVANATPNIDYGFSGTNVAAAVYVSPAIPSETITVRAPAIPVTIFLPLFRQPGMFRVVKDRMGAAANNITIDGNGALIDGAATLVLSTNNAAAQLVFDGTEWIVE